MSVDYKVRQIYNDIIHEVTKNAENWKDVLSLTGRIYRYEFDNILMIYAQKPHSTLVADYDTWKKVDRYVRRGSKGIAIYPSRALQPHCRYVFDISDTGGRKRQLTRRYQREAWMLFPCQSVGISVRLDQPACQTSIVSPIRSPV